MYKVIFIILFISASMLFAQNEENKNNESFSDNKALHKASYTACNCIDSIDTFNKNQIELNTEIEECIKKYVLLYKTFKRIFSGEEKPIETQEDANRALINSILNDNPEENKQFYNEIEAYLYDSCEVLLSVANASDHIRENSMSENQDAIRYFKKGLNLSQGEDTEGAIEAYKSAVEIDSNFVFAWDNLGICYRKAENYEKAIEAYKKSLEIDPDGKIPLINLGIAYSLNNQIDEAIKVYELLIEKDPNDPEGYYGLGQILYQKDNYKGLENFCKSYNLYVEQKSIHRNEVGAIIYEIYLHLKEINKLDVFKEILEKHHIDFEYEE